MRVLVVSAWEPWRTGDGACLILHAHLRRLATRHEVTLVSAGAPGPSRVPPAGTVADLVEATWCGPVLPARLDALARRARRGSEPAHVGFVLRRSLIQHVRAQVASRRPDVVHLFGWGTAALQPLLDGVPAVHDTVDPWAANRGNRAVGTLHALLDHGQQRRVVAHEQRWYPRCSAVVVRTQADAAELSRQVPAAHVAVVPNGVDAGPEPSLPQGAVLAFLGAFDARSNVQAAVELATAVLPQVQRRRPEARALLIGRDPPAAVRALASPSIEVTGTVTDVRPHLERATVLVAPLRSGRGVRNKVLEAMAAGRPVVATPLALRGIPASPGVLTADRPEQLAAAVLDALEDPAAGGRANRAAVRALTWERSAAAVERLWERAAGQACTSTC